MVKPVEVIEKDGRRAEIFYDDCAENPRRVFDELGIMVCMHKRYNLGDNKIKLDRDEFGSWNEVEDHLIQDYNAKVILPLYLYDHSGITMSTTGFSCGWDSGQVGFIFADHASCVKEFGENYSCEAIKKILNTEVELYDLYLRGEVYGYQIMDKRKCPHCHEILEDEYESTDSCFGFYGLEDVKEAANEALNHE